eukprot:6474766-Amphidinium_carterae.2
MLCAQESGQGCQKLLLSSLDFGGRRTPTGCNGLCSLMPYGYKDKDDLLRVKSLLAPQQSISQATAMEVEAEVAEIANQVGSLPNTSAGQSFIQGTQVHSRTDA